jgi:hypothetical protein
VFEIAAVESICLDIHVFDGKNPGEIRGLILDSI